MVIWYHKWCFSFTKESNCKSKQIKLFRNTKHNWNSQSISEQIGWPNVSNVDEQLQEWNHHYGHLVGKLSRFSCGCLLSLYNIKYVFHDLFLFLFSPGVIGMAAPVIGAMLVSVGLCFLFAVLSFRHTHECAMWYAKNRKEEGKRKIKARKWVGIWDPNAWSDFFFFSKSKSQVGVFSWSRKLRWRCRGEKN